MRTLDEIELVHQARDGSREAFGALFQRHAPMAERVCARALGVGASLDDVLQEAALQAWLGLGTLRDPRQFGAWFTGIALNVARTVLRHGRRAPLSYADLAGGTLSLDVPDPGPTPADLSELLDFTRAVRGAIETLPPAQRHAVLLVYLAGLSYRETAATLGIEVGTLKTRLHKARGTLHDRLHTLWMEHMTTTDRPAQVLMRVADVRRKSLDDSAETRSVVLLEEVDGGRQLPIWVGHWESGAIALLLENVKPLRPLTYAFTAALLRAIDAKVEQVHINRLAEETFYAQVVLTGAPAVDARPSDAIALALETGAPIYAARDVLDEVIAARQARGLGDPREATVDARAIVEDILEHVPGMVRKS